MRLFYHLPQSLGGDVCVNLFLYPKPSGFKQSGGGVFMKIELLMAVGLSHNLLNQSYSLALELDDLKPELDQHSFQT